MGHIHKKLLMELTSLRIGGEADVVEVRNDEEVSEVCKYASKNGRHVHVFGEGTNSFFGDALDGVLIVHMKTKGVEIQEIENDASQVLITAQAGELWDEVVLLSVERGLWGLENLSHIPGTVGAAPVQNIGAYGVELSDIFYSLRAYDVSAGAFVEFTKDDCKFGYRDSVLKQHPGRYIVVSVALTLSKLPKPVLSYAPLNTLPVTHALTPAIVRNAVVSTRQAKLPDYHTYPNAGSFFKNPIVTDKVATTLRAEFPGIPLISHADCHKIPAAWLIEHVAHMSGVRVGDVGTWPSQPLVIVNYGNATAAELLAFSDLIVEKVGQGSGVILEREVRAVFID